MTRTHQLPGYDFPDRDPDAGTENDPAYQRLAGGGYAEGYRSLRAKFARQVRRRLRNVDGAAWERLQAFAFDEGKKSARDQALLDQCARDVWHKLPLDEQQAIRKLEPDFLQGVLPTERE